MQSVVGMTMADFSAQTGLTPMDAYDVAGSRTFVVLGRTIKRSIGVGHAEMNRLSPLLAYRYDGAEADESQVQHVDWAAMAAAGPQAVEGRRSIIELEALVFKGFCQLVAVFAVDRTAAS
ncbi:MAG TPA: hypothetical protein VLA00_07740 [Xanthobacteraceae bacterium]|nr:hypothetical protein [Xanthobacteraceae bacterium]